MTVFLARLGRVLALLIFPVGGRGVEIGVWKGDFSSRVLQLRRPAELHLVDPWVFAPHFPRRLYGGKDASSQNDMDKIFSSVQRRFSEIPAVTIHRRTSAEAAGSFPDQYFDWVYIDGDHSYDAVLSDLQAWYLKVKSGGVIVLDDYLWRDEADVESVRVAIKEFLSINKVRCARAMLGQFIICLA